MRRDYWFIRSKLTKTINLKLTKTDSIKITTKGEIAGVLYAHQHFIKANRGFEYKTIQKMKELVKSDFIILDIGANIGMYSIFLSKLVGENGKVYAFEPDSQTASVLAENLSLNNCKNVEVFQIALSDINGRVSLEKSSEVGGDAFNFIKKEDNKSSNSIESNRLDDFIVKNNIGKIDFVKIDIEGAELLCLKGAESMLSSANKPIIVFECYEPFLQRFDHRISDIIVYLSKFNYEIINYDEWQWLLVPKN